MASVDHTIWWQVYPFGATGAPIREEHGEPDHRLRRLDPWLDHAVRLGCSGLLLGPVFASTAHGYDTLDHYRLDPRLGDDADIDHLVEEAHRRGLAVMLDGVFNHVGAHHPLVAAARDGGGLVRMHEGEPVGWEGHGDLAELDHDDPRVADLVTDVMLHWLRRGIDGWRLDVAYAVPPRFWAEVTGRVRAEFPDAIFLGEMIHGDYAGFAREAGLDSMTQYELWKALWSAQKDRNLWELAHALERHAAASRDVVLNTFAGNHDVERMASLAGDEGAAIAAAVVLTVPGMPSIYYGDEHAFRGAKGQGFSADDALRPELPAGPDDLAPDGQWLFDHYRELVGLRRRHPWLVRGALEVVDRTNETLHYAVTADDHRLDAHIDLDGQPRVRIDVDGESFTWPR